MGDRAVRNSKIGGVAAFYRDIVGVLPRVKLKPIFIPYLLESLMCLNDSEKKTVLLAYGLSSGQVMSIKDVSSALGKLQPSVSKLKASAIEKLKSPLVIGYIKELFSCNEIGMSMSQNALVYLNRLRYRYMKGNNIALEDFMSAYVRIATSDEVKRSLLLFSNLPISKYLENVLAREGLHSLVDLKGSSLISLSKISGVSRSTAIELIRFCFIYGIEIETGEHEWELSFEIGRFSVDPRRTPEENFHIGLLGYPPNNSLIPNRLYVIDLILSSQSERNRDVLKFRYGLGGVSYNSIKEISSYYNITDTRTKHLICFAFRSLKKLQKEKVVLMVQGLFDRSISDEEFYKRFPKKV